MKRDRFNGWFRGYSRTHLSPLEADRALIAKLYDAVKEALTPSYCITIGSFPRFTAIRPLHDLDVLVVEGNSESVLETRTVLVGLQARIRSRFTNPTNLTVSVAIQTHSVTMSLSNKSAVVFSIDLVPAIVDGKNEFGDEKYRVPELIRLGRAARRALYEELGKAGAAMRWIQSDPRGYISIAAAVNARNPDFRRSVKIIKAWRSAWKREAAEFPLKSFHIEQVVTGYFRDNLVEDAFGAVFQFFCDLPDIIERPRIQDRANSAVFIDQYVTAMKAGDREQILEARDYFLIQLENAENERALGGLFNPGRRRRRSDSEAYLFDSRIPMFTEEDLRIEGHVLPRSGGFREFVLDKLGIIHADRKIQFRLANPIPRADVFKWKVKNDDDSPQPRGEITDHRTLRDPEDTKYKGRHLVECFAIRGGNCIARGSQSVQLS